MDAELKKKWLEALRSGNYSQTRSNLFLGTAEDGIPPGYCCLGVLCAVAEVPRTLDGKFKKNDYEIIDGWLNNMTFGLEHGIRYKLAALNDEGKSFTEIADWIEANV